MNNQITNPKVEVPKGMPMNDEDMATDILSKEKCLLKDYTVALTEASNEDLHQKLYQMFEIIDNLQREAFELMFRLGWYPMDKAPSEKLTTVTTKLNEELKDLNQ